MNYTNQPEDGLTDPSVQIQQLQQQLRQQRRLRRVEQKLRSSLNLATVFGITVIETAALLKAEQVSLLRFHAQTQSWQSVAQYCQNQALAWQRTFAIAQAEFPQIGEQLQQGKSLCLFTHEKACPDLAAEIKRWVKRCPEHRLLIPIQCKRQIDHSINAERGTIWAKSDAHRLSQSVARSADHDKTFSAGPIAVKEPKDEHWGVMAIAFPTLATQQPLTIPIDQAIATAQSIASELAMAMGQCQQYQELLIANRELQQLALEDGLTRLANRRCFDEQLADEWQRLAREQQPLSLILCDLDHFKRYNDTFGHPAGDRCLIRVARALLNGPQRPADLVARYGGEEFAIVLPNTDSYGAWRIAQKIHRNIRALKIAHAPDHEAAYLTVTMGLSTMVPDHESGVQVLIKAADIALYHAKQQGRNRTYVSGRYNTVNSATAAQNTSDSGLPLAIVPPADTAPSP
ncbi:diguanylate cyclase [Leptolyngbya sp. BC1307]|uniref:diguanylate cyclase n=1 Tax=Leptolyngbya sp. BC1307 TaxID=2029589 RepID=UPI000EFC9B08|nr:diguanylate cyclase [Leptolyngbya sp. BC1307]